MGQRVAWRARLCVCACARARRVCVHECACAQGRVAGRLRQRLLCGKRSQVPKQLGASPCWLHEDTWLFFTLVLLCFPPPLLPSAPPGAGSSVPCSDFRPPGPREGEGERRGADVGARRVGGGKGPSRKGRAALCGGRWEQAPLQHCYLRRRLSPAPRRPAPSRS